MSRDKMDDALDAYLSLLESKGADAAVIAFRRRRAGAAQPDFAQPACRAPPCTGRRWMPCWRCVYRPTVPAP